MSKRYIDADKLLQTLPDHLEYKGAVKRVLIQAPEADVVEVVRCKDCKHFRIWGDSYSTCAHWTYVEDVTTDPNAFCSYGERREENEG